MHPRHLLLLLVVVLIALAAWSLLMGDDPTTGPLERKASQEQVVPRVTESIVVSAPTLAVERKAAPAPASTSSPSSAVASPALSGLVKEEGGEGLPDILVELVDATNTTLLAVTTGAQGEFAFEQVAPEANALVTRPSPHGLPRIRHALPRARPGSRPGGAGIVLWRPPCGVITGRVIDEAGAPVAGAIISTDRPYVTMGTGNWDVLEGEKPRMLFEAKADAGGHFALTFAPRGPHLLRGKHGDRSGSVKVDANEAGVVIRLGAHLGGAIAVTGQLTDRVTGAPIVGARVWVQRVRRSDHGSSTIGVADATTNLQGRYEVQGLEAGTYEIGSMPEGFSKGETEVECDARQHVVDLALLPARRVRVRVLTADGQPAKGVHVHVRDAAGKTVEVPGSMGMLGNGVRVDAKGIVELRRLPAAPLTLLAVQGEFVAAGRLELDLRSEAPPEVTIAMPSLVTSFARQHFFNLLDAEGKPATIEGIVVASSFDGGQLLSRVEGSWLAGKFCFGNDRQFDFSTPTIAVGAIAGACRVEIAAPGYQLVTLTLEPGERSPTTVTLRR